MIDFTKLQHAKIYIVGGYVRDRLLGRNPKDHDYVVCGATPEDMLAAGFVPIEASAFPVFHHPMTHDEFALARAEKKTGPGYHGFECYCDPSLTIEDDLIRRDITINSMAREVVGWNEHGHAKLSDNIIDPFGGQVDLKLEHIRHTSDAFREDPVRVLRVARFAARYDFVISTETTDMMTQMVRDGELDHLTAERVWLEAEKAMSEKNPMIFFSVLDAVGALTVVMPQLDERIDLHGRLNSVWNSVTAAAKDGAPLVHRFALLTSELDESECEQFYVDLKAPSEFLRFAKKINHVLPMLMEDTFDRFTGAERFVRLMEQINAFRDVDLLSHMHQTFYYTANRVANDNMYVMRLVFGMVRDISFNDLDKNQQKELKGPQIGNAIHNKRVAVAQSVLDTVLP